MKIYLERKLKATQHGFFDSIDELNSTVTLNELTREVVRICDDMEEVRKLRVVDMINIALKYSYGAVTNYSDTEDVECYNNYINCFDMQLFRSLYLGLLFLAC